MSFQETYAHYVLLCFTPRIIPIYQTPPVLKNYTSILYKFLYKTAATTYHHFQDNSVKHPANLEICSHALVSTFGFQGQNISAFLHLSHTLNY